MLYSWEKLRISITIYILLLSTIKSSSALPFSRLKVHESHAGLKLICKQFFCKSDWTLYGKYNCENYFRGDCPRRHIKKLDVNSSPTSPSIRVPMVDTLPAAHKKVFLRKFEKWSQISTWHIQFRDYIRKRIKNEIFFRKRKNEGINK